MAGVTILISQSVPDIDHITDFQALWSDDVTLFTICIVDQSDVGRTVRIVFDRSNAAWNAIFIAFEVDDRGIYACVRRHDDEP